jgi:hypothetical protein
MTDLVGDFRTLFDEAFAQRAAFDSHVDISAVRQDVKETENGVEVTDSVTFSLTTAANKYNLVLWRYTRPGRPQVTMIEAFRFKLPGERECELFDEGVVDRNMVFTIFHHILAFEFISLWTNPVRVAATESSEPDPTPPTSGYMQHPEQH